MESNHLNKIQKTIDKNGLNRAKLQALLITDGSVIPKTNKISFANTSKELIRKFCDLIYKVYGYNVPESRIGIGKGTRQTLYIVQFRSKQMCSDLLSDMIYHSSKAVSIPKYWSEFSQDEISGILKSL